jgi:hypothetical protein
MTDYDSWILLPDAGRAIKTYWLGKVGTIKQMLDAFKVPVGASKRVKRVLAYVVLYEARGQVCKCERLKGKDAKPLIKSHYEYQILADVVEKGKSARIALYF